MSEFIPSGRPSQTEAALEMLRTFDQNARTGNLPDSVIEQLSEAMQGVGSEVSFVRESAPEIELAVEDAERTAANAKEYAMGPIEAVEAVEAARMLVDLDGKVADARELTDDSSAALMHAQVGFQLSYSQIKEQYVRDALGIEEGSEADLAVTAAMQPLRDEYIRLDGEIDMARDIDAQLREDRHKAIEGRLAEAEADPEGATDQLPQNLRNENAHPEVRNAVNAADQDYLQPDNDGPIVPGE
jgi:hypothetical protein